MNTKIPITITGNLVADPELTIGESGTPHAKLRVAVNQRIQNPDGTWRDGEPVFHNVSAFRMLAENASTSLKKGDPVTVSGELEFRSYDKDGERREARRIIADTIGPDLRFGTATYQRSARAVCRAGGRCGGYRATSDDGDWLASVQRDDEGAGGGVPFRRSSGE